MTVEKILLVEDSKTETMIITKILEDAGFTVENATNADQAMERLRMYKPDLILMDVVMPGQNGFQATRAIARDPLTQHVPIIICTSKGQETDRIWGLRQGARDYIVKPVDPQLLLQKIAAIARGVA